MVFVIISALVGLVAGLMIWSRDGRLFKLKLGEHILNFLQTGLLVLLGFVVGSVIALGVGAALPQEYVMDRQIELVAMRDTRATEGSFFLGTGRIKSEFYYVFYQKEDNGGVRFGKIPVEETIVYEEERSDGLIKVYMRQFTKEWYKLFGLPILDEKYEIFIPKGSILYEFQLDLK